jgi:hypothetical protein
MYNSLRDVASQELYDSYRGILRISPNIIDNIEEDNTEYFFNPSNNVDIILSDSDGNILEALQFKAKKFSTSMVGYTSNIDLSVITHNYTALNVSKSLALTSILSVNDSLKIINPLSNRTNILIYPSDSPYDAAYCNLNDKLGIKNNYDDDVIETGFSNKDLVTLLGSNSYTQVEIDGQKIFRESTAGTLIPEVYRHDYILGQAKGGTYKKDNAYITQLSFVSLDKMVWEKLTANLKGLYRHLDGRYKNLGHGRNEEIMTTLFGDTNIDLSDKAHIVGVPVQSGLITYNAMPIRRYFFHLNSTHNSTATASTSYVKNLITEYALCDGGVLKNSNGGTDYSKINKNSRNWKNFDFSDTIKNEYYGIFKSGIENGTTQIRTPRLFEIDQLSSRFIRGLNWTRTSTNITKDDNNFTRDNSKRMNDLDKTVNDKLDEGIIVKDIYLAGPYFANHDYKVRKVVEHHHLALANENADPGASNDKIYSNVSEFKTGVDHKDNIIMVANHTNYKNADGSAQKWHGTMILRTSGETNLGEVTQKELSDAPIAYNGGTRASLNHLGYNWKGCGCIDLDPIGCGCPGCDDAYVRTKTAPGFFSTKGLTNPGANNWRTISSLQIQNKYGEISESQFTKKYSTATWDSGGPVNIDDTLPAPACINFIPLMKI